VTRESTKIVPSNTLPSEKTDFLNTLIPSLTIEGFMRPMNTILADIVLAVGGTVTNPNNRNQLLADWLLAL